MRANCGKTSFSVIQKCCYSVQTGSRAVEKVRVLKEEGKVTRLPNGVNIATVENLSPVVRLAYVINAGSRYESVDNLGVTHVIRRATILANKKYSNFGLVRNLQQIGASLTCSTTREQVIYAVECLRSQVPLALDILSNAALTAEFKPWEVSDNTEYIKRDLLALDLDPEAQVVELLHKAAYRTTLGNSIYTPSYLVGKHSPQQLKQFTEAHHTAGNLSILALGADQDSVSAIHRRGDLLTPSAPGPAVKPQKAKYHGGELRKDTGNELVHVAVATESVGLKENDYAAVQVLEQILGGYPRIRHSNGATNAKLAKAVALATKAPFAVRCVNYAYSDSGLFGFHIVTGKDEVGKALKAATGAFSSIATGGITEEDVKSAKTRVKAELLYGEESTPSHIFALARQVALTGQIIPSDRVEATINKVTLQDVQNVAKKVLQSKPTLAAVGDLSKTPYLDELRS